MKLHTKFLVLVVLVNCIGSAMADSPVIYGPNNTSKNIQQNLWLLNHLVLTNPNVGPDYGMTFQIEGDASVPWTAKFPATPGTSGQVMTTDGTGTLSWTTIPGVSVPLGQQAWVTPNGNDGTGAVGNAAKPFLTIAAAETAITDAAISKRYAINIGAGTFESPATKKSYISWIGLGDETTYIDSSSPPINLTGPDLAVSSSQSLFNFTHLHFVQAVNMDTVAAGIVAPSGAQYWFDDAHFDAAAVAKGLGGDTVAFECQDCYLNSGYTADSVNANIVGSYVAGTVNVYASGGLGNQALNLGTSILAAVNVYSADNTSDVFGIIGGLVGGAVTIDGSASQGIFDVGSLASDPTLVNGGQSQYRTARTNDIAVISSTGQRNFVVGSNGWLGIGTATPMAPLHVTPPNNTTAMFDGPVADDNSLRIYSGGTSRMYFQFGSLDFTSVHPGGMDANGLSLGRDRVLISSDVAGGPVANSSITARLEVVGEGDDSSTLALDVQNSTPTSLLTVRDDGLVSVPSKLGVAGSGAETLHVGGGTALTAPESFFSASAEFGSNVTIQSYLEVVSSVKIDDTGGSGGNVPHEIARRSSSTATSSSCTVTCNTGEILTGGGCQNSGTIALQENYPSADDTWTCNFALATGTCTAWAVCAAY